MIQIRDITYRPAQQATPLFTDFSMDLAQSEFTVLLGESGTGKSTQIGRAHV